MKNEFETYLVAYRYEGKEWNLQIPARSFDDARQRIGQLALGRVEGVVIASVPAVFSPFVALAAFIQNALSRAFASRA
jgi:hypothetical protein